MMCERTSALERTEKKHNSVLQNFDLGDHLDRLLNDAFVVPCVIQEIQVGYAGLLVDAVEPLVGHESGDAEDCLDLCRIICFDPHVLKSCPFGSGASSCADQQGDACGLVVLVLGLEVVLVELVGVLELAASVDQALVHSWYALFALDLSLDHGEGVTVTDCQLEGMTVVSTLDVDLVAVVVV